MFPGHPFFVYGPGSHELIKSVETHSELDLIHGHRQPSLLMGNQPQAFDLSLSGTHTVILSGSFRPEFSYQENIWAEHLARRGQTVTVVTASVTHTQPYDVNGYRVIYVRCRGLHTRHLYLETRVGQVIAELCPDRIIWFGAPQRFGRSVLSKRGLRSIPMAYLWGKIVKCTRSTGRSLVCLSASVSWRQPID